MVKRATLAELPYLAPLFDAYRRFYGQASDPEAAAAFLWERMTQEDSVIFLFYEGSMAAGFTQLYPIFSSVSMRKAWLLNDLFVKEEGRNKGVATALLQKAKEWGTATGAKWLLLSTAVDNHSAKALYRSNGWKEVTDAYFEYILDEH